MNIFASSPDPAISATALDDRRLVKMTLETAQILCSALHRLLPSDLAHELAYKPTHTGHPCVVWAATSIPNFLWLVAHGIALAEEYHRRFGREHKSLSVIRSARLTAIANIQRFPATALTPHVNCTTLQHLSDPHAAYRHYLIKKWAADAPPHPRWTASTPPVWYNPQQETA